MGEREPGTPSDGGRRRRWRSAGAACCTLRPIHRDGPNPLLSRVPARVPIPDCGKQPEKGQRSAGRAGGWIRSGGAATAHADAPPTSRSLSPTVLGYVVGPVALAILLVFRHYGLIARLPVWAYLLALLGSAALSAVVEPWYRAPPGSLKLYARVAVHWPR